MIPRLRVPSVLGARVLAILVISSVTIVHCECPTFREVDSTFKCDPDCLTDTSKPVYGTLMYGQDSDVCRASLHAGALNLTGGSVIIAQRPSPGRSIQGVCRNRVCSQSFIGDGNVYTVKETSPVITGKIGGDMMLIHNNYHNDKINILCLSEHKDHQISADDMRSWNFGTLSSKPSVKEPTTLLATYSASDNRHAMHCMGMTPATDAFSPFIFSDAKFQSSHLTWRANRGDSFNITFLTQDDLTKGTQMRRFPDKVSGSVSLGITNASAEDSGLYLIGDNKMGAYFNIIVRDCEEGKYGSECQFKCPTCLNGGQCHSYTGECLCPPGFKGNRCQEACPMGMLGSDCQFSCDQDTLLFELPEAGTCRGLSVCLPSPLGCTCPAGYKGSLCKEDCEVGKYGSGCLESCQTKCQKDDCHHITGKCPPSLPKTLAVKISSNTTLSVEWNTNRSNQEESDQDKLEFHVNYKLLTLMSCNYTEPTEEWEEIKGQESPIDIPGLEAHASYNVCVKAVRESDGKTTEQACYVEETGVEIPTLNITSLDCTVGSTEYSESVTCSAKLEGTCAHYNGPDAYLQFSLSYYDSCDEESFAIQELVPLDPGIDEFHSGVVSHVFEGLQSGQLYSPKVKVYKVPVPEEVSARDVFTRRRAPPPVGNLSVDIINMTEARLRWESPCMPNGNSLLYNITVEDKKFKQLNDNDTECSDLEESSRCFTLRNLQIGASYGGTIRVGAAGYWSEPYKFTFKVAETKPGKPQLADKILNENSIEVSLSPPARPGGKLVNCTSKIAPAGINRSVVPVDVCTVTVGESSPLKCKFTDLEPGTFYRLEAHCCNTAFCGKSLKTDLATVAKPEFNGTLEVGMVTTNDSVPLYLPKIVRTGISESHYVVVVERMTPGKTPDTKLEEKARLILEDPNQKCINCNKEEKDDEEVWIAAVVPGTNTSIVVGDGNTYEGYYNRPLKRKETYMIGVFGVVTLKGTDGQIFEWMELSEPVEPIPHKEKFIHLMMIIGILAIILLVVMIISVVLIKRSCRTKHEEEVNVVEYTKEEKGAE